MLGESVGMNKTKRTYSYIILLLGTTAILFSYLWYVMDPQAFGYPVIWTSAALMWVVTGIYIYEAIKMKKSGQLLDDPKPVKAEEPKEAVAAGSTSEQE